jgi:hypothetical protein
MPDKKDIKNSSVLVQLYKNRKLATKVDNMLDEGQTYDYICDFCKEQGLSISKASLTNYKKKREEAVETGKPLLQLLDKRTKDNVTYITDRETKAFKKKKDNLPAREDETVTRVSALNKMESVFSDLEFLDEIIHKGMKGLRQFDVVDTPLALKAVELRAKITNNQLSGLTIAGLRELKLLITARESVFTELIMKYVPEDQHDKLFDEMDELEAQFYANLDLTEEGKRVKKAFDQMGL